jgi:hypothetical protein
VSEFVVGESVLVEEVPDDFDGLRTFLQVAEERGHPAPSVVVDEQARVITHPDYVDRMGVPHIGAGAWAFCRRIAAEALGLSAGTDWVRDHAVHLMFTEGVPYQSSPHFYSQLYVQRFSSAEPFQLTPMCLANPPAWSTDGSRLCVLEERLGHITDGTQMAAFVLWEYELAVGGRRRVAEFTAVDRLHFVELSYSPDNTLIHLCEWGSGRNLLIRVTDGLVIPLPITSRAVAWNPRAGGSMMTVMTPDPESTDLVVEDYDAAEDVRTPRARIGSPTGLPMEVRELSMSLDGRALVTAPVGVRGIDALPRGGVYIATVIDIDNEDIYAPLPVRYQTPGAQRRHTSPRWCEDRRAARVDPTTIADRLLDRARPRKCEPDDERITRDHVARWVEVLNGLEWAWRIGAVPRSRFAQEFAQHAISCAEVTPEAAEDVLHRLSEQARNAPEPGAILRWISSGRRLGSPVRGEKPSPGVGVGEAPPPDPAEGPLQASFGRLVAGETTNEAIDAVREILATARRAGHGADQVWAWLAVMTSAALGRRNYIFVAVVGLGTCLWNDYFLPRYPVMAQASRLGPTRPHELLPLMVNCFEATTHLPAGSVVVRDGDGIFDAESVRHRAQAALSRLPLGEDQVDVVRPTRCVGSSPVVHDPTISYVPDGEESRVRRKRVFISYVREDAATVDLIAAALTDSGADVWMDRTHLLPGMRWSREIRNAIRGGDYFVACFSPAYTQRAITYMNAELLLAIDQLHLMPRHRTWFLPVILRPCALPDHPIGAGETLESLHWVDFSADWESAIAQLIKAVSADGASGP